MLREFSAELRAFGEIDVTGRGVRVLQEAAEVTSKAIVLGNAFGPGAPLDTGFLRSSFRVARNAPDDGPSEPPVTPAGRRPGDPPIFAGALDTSAAQLARLGDSIYCTTIAAYAVYLEEGGMVRRNGDPTNVGAPTPFIAPVEARFLAIVDDAADRVGYGR
jgi:hypothetical protein